MILVLSDGVASLSSPDFFWIVVDSHLGQRYGYAYIGKADVYGDMGKERSFELGKRSVES